MKIYIASSWKNQHAVEMLTEYLRKMGHEIISFVEKADKDETRRNWKKGATYKGQGFDEWVASKKGEEKFYYDLNGATRSELVIYIGPSGTDAWAELGAAWGSGTPIIGLWAKGEQAGLMRRMVRYWFANFRELLAYIEAAPGAKK